MKISELGTCIETSLTRQLYMMAKEYDDAIDLTLGDPNFITPQNIRDAATKAAENGHTHYSMNAGCLETRETIVSFLQRSYDAQYDANQVIVTTGAMGALYQCLRCLVNPGDEVVIPSPHWVNYAHMTQLCGGEAIFVPTRSDNGFHVRANEIEKYVSSKTKVLIINSPNNPTGAVLTEKEIREIAEVVLKYDIALITDEAYSAICYSDRYFSFLQIPEVRPNLILIDSCSKRYAMTGWRIGYAVGPQELIDSMVKMQENVVACASVPAQFAAIEALNGSQESVRRMRDEFQQRRDYLYGRICTMDKVKMYHPEGAFYAFVDIRDTNMDSLTFARTLLQIMHVAVVPGITYGSAGEGYVRIAYTVDMQSLVCACDRLEVFLKEGV